MTIHLPDELENWVHAAVGTGRFASVDDLMTEALRLLLNKLKHEQLPGEKPVDAGDSVSDPVLGLMRDDAELMDEIVADAYRHRREETWRELEL